MLIARVVGSSAFAAAMPFDVSPRRRVGERVAAAPHAELAGHRRKGQDRRRRGASVAAALGSPAAAQRRGREVRVESREGFDVGRRHARLARRALERPGLRAPGELLGAVRVARRGTPRSARPCANSQRMTESASGRSVPGWIGKVQVRVLGLPSPPRVDDDEAGAALLRLLDVAERGGFPRPTDSCPRRRSGWRARSPGRRLPAILPYNPNAALLDGAAQTVLSRREAPRR